MPLHRRMGALYPHQVQNSGFKLKVKVKKLFEKNFLNLKSKFNKNLKLYFVVFEWRNKILIFKEKIIRKKPLFKPVSGFWFLSYKKKGGVTEE